LFIVKIIRSRTAHSSAGWSVHCRIERILFPVLSLIGVLKVVSVISFDWNFFWLVFLVILVASFVPGSIWKKYS